MQPVARWTRVLAMFGLAAMIIGLIDPLEGSVVLLFGCGLTALSAFMGQSRYRTLLLWSFGLMFVGVGALWGISAVGGFGGPGGRSFWWGLLLLPYPVGWLMGLIGGFRRLREVHPV